MARLSNQQRGFLFFVLGIVLVGVILLIAFVPPPPVARSVSTLPTVVTAGVLCTQTPDQFMTIDDSCAEYDETLCDNRRGVFNQTCIRESCTPGLNAGDTFQALPITDGGEITETHFLGVLLRANNALVTMMQMIQKLMIENLADSYDPVIDPPPQPLADSITFTADDYEGSFTLLPLEWVRQHFIAGWNVAAMFQYDGYHQDNTTVDTLYHIVFVPENCPDSGLGDIPWIQYHNVTYIDILFFGSCMIALNTSSVAATEEGFADYCATFCPVPTALCDVVGSYYTYTSLANVSETPSLYQDLNTMDTQFNLEFQDCLTPAGCMGVPLV